MERWNGAARSSWDLQGVALVAVGGGVLAVVLAFGVLWDWFMVSASGISLSVGVVQLVLLEILLLASWQFLASARGRIDGVDGHDAAAMAANVLSLLLFHFTSLLSLLPVLGLIVLRVVMHNLGGSFEDSLEQRREAELARRRGSEVLERV